MKETKRKVVSIGEAARICNVTVKQIRFWEERGYIPSAQRVICGERSYRKFGEEDLEIIKRIARYLNDGFTLGAAAKKAAIDISAKEENENA